MCTSIRQLLLEFLGTWLYLSLGGLGTIHRPYLPSLTWGAAYTLGALLAGQSSHLNPAISLGMTASGLSTFTSLPARIIGQCGGALLAAITLLGVAPGPTVHTMMDDTNNTDLIWAEPWFTVPLQNSSVFSDILTFTIAAVILQMVFCASAGSALYHGISLTTIITIFTPPIGAGLNPAREVFGRLVVSFYHWDWKIFFYQEVWVWIPIAWSFAGCLSGALIYWLTVEIPRHCETRSNRINKSKDGYEIPYTIDPDEDDEFNPTVVLSEKPLTEKPPAPPAIPNFNKSPPQQLKSYLEDKETSPTAIKKFCKKNQISTPELEHYLARYRAVSVDHLDLGSGVTVTVTNCGDGTVDEKDR